MDCTAQLLLPFWGRRTGRALSFRAALRMAAAIKQATNFEMFSCTEQMAHQLDEAAAAGEVSIELVRELLSDFKAGLMEIRGKNMQEMNGLLADLH